MIDLLDPNDLTPLQLGAWRDLAARAAEPNPFFDPALVLPAVRHLPDGPDVRLLVARRRDRWIAALPVLPSRRWRRFPLACTVGWTHRFCFLGTPLLAADDLDRAAAALVGAPGRVTPEPLLVLESVCQDGPVATALHDALDGPGPYALHHERRAALVRRDADDYVDGHRSGKRRREAKRLRARLERELAAPLRLVDHAATADALEQFLTLEAAGWKGREGSAIASDPASAAFFRAIADAPTATVATHVLELGVPRRPAAMLLTLRAGTTAFAVKLAHDEQLAPAAPGVQLMAASASWFHHQPGVMRFDSCARPHNRMVNALWPDRRATASMAFSVAGLAGALPRALLRGYATAQRHRPTTDAEPAASAPAGGVR